VWTQILNRTNQIRQHLVENHAPSTGLLPDFAIQDTGVDFDPAPPGFLEGDDDGKYSWNALRIPIRLGVDFALTGNPALADQISLLNEFIHESASGDPGEIMPGYELDGTPITTEWRSIAFAAPFTVTAMADTAHPDWLNDLWEYSVDAGSEGYYPDALRMLSLLIASGNWWQPEWVSNNFRVVKKKVNRKTGVGTVTVRADSPGRLKIKKTGKVRQSTAKAKAGKKVKLAVRAKGKAKRRLANGKAVKVKFTVRFTPDGGKPATRKVTLKLRKKR